LETLLRALVKKNIKEWDELLSHAEFAFNKAPSKATGLSPFQIVYGQNPRTPLDLIPIPTSTKFSWEAEKRAREIQDLHSHVRERIEKSNAQAMNQANKHKKNVQYEPRYLVWIHLRKERFSSKRKSKLMPRSDGPFEILEKIGPNAYKVDLLGEYGVSATFNVSDLNPYYNESEDISSLRSNSHQAGEDYGDHPTKDPKGAEEAKEAQEATKDAKRIQTMVKNLVFQAQNILPVHPEIARFLCIC